MMKTEPTDEEIISNLVLELSLVTALPVGAGGRNFIRATAAANSMAYRTEAMNKKDLRNFEWTVQPLLNILLVDIEDPMAAKAAYALRTLMNSRVCMSRLLESNGLSDLAKVLDIIISRKTSELKQKDSTMKQLADHISAMYRDIAVHYRKEIVDVGGLRHCVGLLRYGDVKLQTIATSTLASLSSDLEICKQMFSYGAIKPLLNITNASVTNDACMLAGLGCICQLCQVPEIAARMVQQGALPVLEKSLHVQSGHSLEIIREKALYALGLLSKIQELRPALCTDKILDGLAKEFQSGTIVAKTNILQILMSLHKKYPRERFIVKSIRDEVMNVLKTGPWHTRNLCIKVFCVLYRMKEDQEYFVSHGIVDSIINVIKEKNIELQEAPIVAFLHLLSHPEIPFYLLKRKVPQILANLLSAQDLVIRELAVICLKGFLLYNRYAVERVVPVDKKYLLERDILNPSLFGSEYGGMVLEFFQNIIEHRRDQNYLINQFSAQEIAELNVSEEDLHAFQNTFMEVDLECAGFLGLDELKMLMVLMGQKFDKEELQELLEEYDLDRSGTLDFREFVLMMQSWDEKFGTGLRRFVNETTKRGVIGKSVKKAKRWWNQAEIDKAEIQAVKERKREAQANMNVLKRHYMPHEKLEVKRERAIQFRELLRWEAQGSEYTSERGDDYDQSEDYDNYDYREDSGEESSGDEDSSRTRSRTRSKSHVSTASSTSGLSSLPLLKSILKKRDKDNQREKKRLQIQSSLKHPTAEERSNLSSDYSQSRSFTETTEGRGRTGTETGTGTGYSRSEYSESESESSRSYSRSAAGSRSDNFTGTSRQSSQNGTFAEASDARSSHSSHSSSTETSRSPLKSVISSEAATSSTPPRRLKR